jgi:hypothetical protein
MAHTELELGGKRGGGRNRRSFRTLLLSPGAVTVTNVIVVILLLVIPKRDVFCLLHVPTIQRKSKIGFRSEAALG